MKSLLHLTFAVIVGVVACASDEEEPLSAESLQRVARAQGDAEGQEFAGQFVLSGESLGCDCPDMYVADDVDLCAVLEVDTSILPAKASQHEGLVVIEIGGAIALIGAVDSDGSFATASILDASVINIGGQILSLFTGAFDDEGFTGQITNRFVGSILGEAIDCRADSMLSAVRVSGGD